MAGTVQSNVNINVNADVSNASKAVNDLRAYIMNLNGEIKKISDFKIDIGTAIPEGMLDGYFDNFGESVKETDEDIEVLKNAFGSGKDIISQFASHLGINTGKVQEFGAVLGKLSPEGQAACVGIAAIIGTFTLLSKEIDEAIDTFKDFTLNTVKEMPDMFADIATDGIDLFVDSLSNMKDMIDTAIESMQELSEIGIETNDALFIMNNYLGTEGASQLHEYISALGGLNGVNITGMETSLKGLYGSLSNMNLDAGELDRYAKTFVNFMNDLSVYQGTTVEAIGGQLENALSFGVLNSRSALAKALDITDEMIDQFKELSTVEERAQWILGRWPIFAGKYNEWMETDQGKVTMLKNSWENLMGTVGQLALKVYAMVAPLLTQLLNLANSVLSGIYNLFNIDANSAVSSAVSGYSGLADSIEAVGKAAEKAERKTASFDDVIQISDSGSSGDMSSAIGQAVDMANILDEINKLTNDGESLWQKYADAINNAISVGNWREAGKLLSQFVYEWLDTINWSTIYENIYELGRNIGDFFNGIVSNKRAWLKAGETIGKSFNAVTLGIKTFFKTFDGADFGDSLGFMWKNMWDTFDEQQAADALYEVFNDVFETVGGFLEHGGFMSIADSIKNTITGFFGDIAENGNASEYANTIYSLVENIFSSFANVIYTVVTDENTKSTIKEALGTLFSNLASDADDLANNLVTLITGILSFIGETIVTPENVNNLVGAITTFISTIADKKDEIVAALKPIITTLTDGLKQLVHSGAIDEAFSTIYDVLTESGVFDLIAQWVSLQLQIKWNAFLMELGAKLSTFGAWLLDGAKDILNLFKVIVGIIGLGGVYLGKGIKAVINGVIDIINTGIKSIVGGINSLLNAGSGLLDKVGINVGEITFTGIPKLATGGIVTRPTMTITGEAGAEAVLPLERNTQWMDNLANKIASRIGYSNQSVTIDLSKCTKEYYTKSEMIAMGEHYAKCLKQAGMNVAVIM